MRKLFLLLFVLSSSMLVKAQFGYYSNSDVMQSLPSYKQAATDYERLCKRCEKEIEHNERELTRQYVAFIVTSLSRYCVKGSTNCNVWLTIASISARS